MNGDIIDYHLAQIHTKMKRIYLLLSLLTGCLYMQAAIYNVRDFGAKADGKAIDSPAINRAIEAQTNKPGKICYTKNFNLSEITLDMKDKNAIELKENEQSNIHFDYVKTTTDRRTAGNLPH